MSATLLSEWCNIFGGETSNVVNLGGLGGRPDVNWFCPTLAVGKFRMTCAHGHKGQIMAICQKHYDQFKSQVKFCPRCNPPDQPGHRCDLVMEHVS
jgi:hypothetical protein